MKQAHFFSLNIPLKSLTLQFWHKLFVQIPDEFTIWQFSSEGVQSSTLVTDSVIYFGTENGKIFAQHMDTGKEIWHFETERPICSKAILYQNIVLVKVTCKVYAFNMERGNEIWSYVPNNENHGPGSVTQYDYSAPVVYKDIVCFRDDWGNNSGVDHDNGELGYHYTSSVEYVEINDWFIRCTPTI